MMLSEWPKVNKNKVKCRRFLLNMRESGQPQDYIAQRYSYYITLEIRKAKTALAALAQAGVGLDGLQRYFQPQPPCDSDVTKKMDSLSVLISR